jgi:hypothetical protein
MFLLQIANKLGNPKKKVFSDDLYSDSTLCLTLSVKQCMYVEVRPPNLWRFMVWKMLTFVVGLYCVAFINPVGVVTSDRKQETSYWTHLCRTYLKTETVSSLQNVLF